MQHELQDKIECINGTSNQFFELIVSVVEKDIYQVNDCDMLNTLTQWNQDE